MGLSADEDSLRNVRKGNHMRKEGKVVLSAAMSAVLAVSLCPALALADEATAETSGGVGRFSR